MTITTTGTAPRLSALQRYESLAGLASDSAIYVNWSLLAADLRIEARQYSDERREDRIGRALECDARALRAACRLRDRVAIRPGDERTPVQPEMTVEQIIPVLAGAL